MDSSSPHLLSRHLAKKSTCQLLTRTQQVRGQDLPGNFSESLINSGFSSPSRKVRRALRKTLDTWLKRMTFFFLSRVFSTIFSCGLFVFHFLHSIHIRFLGGRDREQDASFIAGVKVIQHPGYQSVDVFQVTAHPQTQTGGKSGSWLAVWFVKGHRLSVLHFHERKLPDRNKCPRK